MGFDPISIGLIIGGAGLLTGTTSAVMQSKQASKARRSQNLSRIAEQRMQNIKAARERRQAIRQARMARAQLQSRAVAAGTTETSGIAGGQAGVQQQLASNLSFLNQAQQLTTAQSIFQQQAADRMGRAKEIEGFGNAIQSGLSLFGGMAAGGGGTRSSVTSTSQSKIVSPGAGAPINPTDYSGYV